MPNISTRETNTSALTAQAQASVQARYLIAQQRPRNLDDVRVRLIAECRRRSFAESALYLLPVGGGIRGLSIRFAEAAIRELGNVHVEVVTIFDDSEREIVRVTLSDLERNVSMGGDVVITKTVERHDQRGRTPIDTRLNDRGKTIFIFRATPEEHAIHRASLISKSIRTAALRLIPGDLIEECTTWIESTLATEAAKDPNNERKRLCDAFAELGVSPGELARYLGHPLASVSPSELAELRAVYQSIRDHEASWHEIVAPKDQLDETARDHAAKRRKKAGDTYGDTKRDSDGSSAEGIAQDSERPE